MELSGIAHIQLTVNRYDVCVPFYEALCKFMGMKLAFKGNEMMYYVGGKTAIAITPSHDKFKAEKFEQQRIGLHHLCLRAKSRDDIDSLYKFLKSKDVKIVHEPEEGPWAPGYYSILFEDPDGIRIEVNHVPGKGIFDKDKNFNPADDYS